MQWLSTAGPEPPVHREDDARDECGVGTREEGDDGGDGVDPYAMRGEVDGN